ncbi:hypothetical protein EW145_g6093 [Phellinidium pouzarii]|uniref:Uncharacterized protein n=1 Tax=Phellinidium pouzarii TaxID=167371 RepID=A0A4S4KXS7_9AGAM|nr:hypothetical protein EW145_g6093 [Phellinidium pouzarii]
MVSVISITEVFSVQVIPSADPPLTLEFFTLLLVAVAPKRPSNTAPEGVGSDSTDGNDTDAVAGAYASRSTAAWRRFAPIIDVTEKFDLPANKFEGNSGLELFVMGLRWGGGGTGASLACCDRGRVHVWEHVGDKEEVAGVETAVTAGVGGGEIDEDARTVLVADETGSGCDLESMWRDASPDCLEGVDWIFLL